MMITPMGRALRPIVLAAAVSCLLAAASTAQSVRPSVPRAVELIKMVRMTMVAVHHANFTGNYTVLRDLGTPGFAKRNTAARLARIFRRWRRPDRNLGAVLVLKPKWLVRPVVNRQGLLSLKGYFATSPLRVRFDMLFKPVAGRWRLAGISLKTFKPSKAGSARR